jgi:hypothetical protein
MGNGGWPSGRAAPNAAFSLAVLEMGSPMVRKCYFNEKERCAGELRLSDASEMALLGDTCHEQRLAMADLADGRSRGREPMLF